jgi:hypothetical protein
MQNRRGYRVLLRRITEHVKAQNWTAVALDFLIVVVGVFIGIQVSNWNGNQADDRAYQVAMRRLAEESAETLRSAEEVRANINAMLSDVQPAIDVLRDCRIDADAVAIVNTGLNTIRSARALSASTIAIDQLVDDQRLLNQQSDAERVALRQYHTSLHAINSTAEFVLRTANAGEDSHPLFGFTAVVDPATTINGVDIRRAVVNAPLAQACRDTSFLKVFYRWERSHVYQLQLLEELEAVVSENVQSLNLADFDAEPGERAE